MKQCLAWSPLSLDGVFFCVGIVGRCLSRSTWEQSPPSRTLRCQSPLLDMDGTLLWTSGRGRKRKENDSDQMFCHILYWGLMAILGS